AAFLPQGDHFPASGGYSVIDVRSLVERCQGFSVATSEKSADQEDRKNHDSQSVARPNRARVPETSSSKGAKSNSSEYLRRRFYLTQVADAYLERGQVEYLRSNYDTALALHLRSLRMHQEFPMGKDETIATLYNEIGTVCAAMGKHRQAIKYYEKALETLRGILGPEHSRVATCHNNIGASLLAQNDKALGKMHLLQAMAIFQKRFGPYHTHTKTAREWLDSI
ncbi:MAG: tetratricopeptide repeat protein, partial [Opitutales bacterium]